MKKTLFFLAAIMLVSSTLMAQKIKVKEGSSKALKGVKEMNITFHYNDMTVGKKLTEEEYINKKVEEYNEDEPGRGDEWRTAWTTDREERFEPKFIELFNEYSEKSGLSVQKEESLPYTLMVQTYYTEPGFNVGVMRRPAMIHVMYTVVKTGTDEVIVKYNQEDIPGADAMGFDYDTGARIAEAYAKAGKSLAKFLAKELK